MHIVPLSRFPGVVMHVSDDVFQHYEETFKTTHGLYSSAQEMIEHDYDAMFHERVSGKFHRFVQLYGKKVGRSGIAVLDAHGGSVNGKWNFRDGIKSLSVQAWIHRNAKKYAALVLVVCNADGNSVSSKSGLIFIPDNFVGSGFFFDAFHDLHFTLRLPDGEEIDSNTIDWHLRNV